MNTKKIIILAIAIVLVIVIIAAVVMVGGKNSITKKTANQPTPTKEVGFVVVRVLPSGFSPKEVTINQGMIVRFTNPTDTKVLIKWQGEKQYTKGLVFDGNDIATEAFDKAGTYTFSDDASIPHNAKVIVK
jgi:plastocyanin